jgi:hypothetical protein
MSTWKKARMQEGKKASNYEVQIDTQSDIRSTTQNIQ